VIFSVLAHLRIVCRFVSENFLSNSSSLSSPRSKTMTGERSLFAWFSTELRDTTIFPAQHIETFDFSERANRVDREEKIHQGGWMSGWMVKWVETWKNGWRMG
jgi:hypothetical protein